MKSVLVIDDEPAIREVIQHALHRSGFEVFTAADGIAGFERYRERPTDIVIVDIILPKSDGISVIAKIRGINPSVRIIAMTGGGNFASEGYKPSAVTTDAYLMAATKWGADVVMNKPFGREELLSALHGLDSH